MRQETDREGGSIPVNEANAVQCALPSAFCADLLLSTIYSDGLIGPQTIAAMLASPVDGFPKGATC